MIGQPAEAKIQVNFRDDVAVAALEGDLDLHISANLRERLLGLINDHRAMVVDLARVTGIDSSGVASLLEVFQRANKRQKKFALAAAGEPVLRVLRMARLDNIFVLATTVDEALARMRQP
jgi:anti-anti-sigma factor